MLHLFIYLKCVTSCSFLPGIWIKENMASSASIVLSYHLASKVAASLGSNVWVYPNSIHPSPAINAIHLTSDPFYQSIDAKPNATLLHSSKSDHQIINLSLLKTTHLTFPQYLGVSNCLSLGGT